MYLHKLEKDEKTTFLAFARHLAQVDDQRIDDNERFMLQYMMGEMGLDAADVTPPFSVQHTVNVFHREVARRILVLEGIGVAAANGAIEVAQRKLLTELAEKFSLPDDFVARAEAAVRKQIEMMNEFERLIQP